MRFLLLGVETGGQMLRVEVHDVVARQFAHPAIVSIGIRGSEELDDIVDGQD